MHDDSKGGKKIAYTIDNQPIVEYHRVSVKADGEDGLNYAVLTPIGRQTYQLKT